jgi:serine/threonine protein kinase
MKYCPICERNYGEELDVCQMDGATLKILGVKQDRYLNQVIKGRYRVLKKLGEGGMGTVYLAEQVSIKRKVALKLLQGNFAADDEFIARFRREAHLAASLNHRNIITIYDFDQADDGTLFIAMEYVDGKRLSDAVRQDGPLPIRRAMRLGIQIAEGLESAHRSGVIHRDIKPDNIMIVGEDEFEQIKLMDFGIARLRDTGTMMQLTRSGVIMGTPQYMSPEQAEGAEVSDKTDIYALGIVLYEMISGKVPFTATTPGAVLVKQMQEAPVSLRKVRRELPTAVEKLVMRTLEKKPERRQQSMREVVQELQKAAVALPEEASKTVVETIAISKTVVGNIKRPQSKPAWAIAVAVPAFVVLLLIMIWRPWSKDTEGSTRILALTIQGEKKEFKPRERTTLRVAGKYSDGTQTDILKNLEWRSSDPSIVKINSNGEIEAVNNGSAQITASHEGLVSEPIALIVKGDSNIPSLADPNSRSKSATEIKIENHLKMASLLRDRGDYTGALSELARAKTVDSKNEVVLAEFEKTKSACLAEKSLGISKLRCD